MAGASSLKHRIERRLREVQREAELVREDVRTLRSALADRDRLERLPKLKSARIYRSRIPPPSRHDPVREKPTSPPKVEPPTARPVAAPPSPPEEENIPLAGPPVAKPRPVQRDERFANLFSSSGFLGTAASSPVDHRVQRNKAIFVLICVLVALFIVINLLSY